ncbi:hypothetical protein Mpet_0292 [Methanolacinia petrolearia DSM 11571]|uniref:Uncharacterized protein n=1 Tax=Methanolacinia petrolearia (strain DSM 11571 / OCM 486 / SEBR 4847) TaxID=679926 RepID=E1RFC1_METP4|nr:hypothetical protein [Methanolacinia petrolearia]ADN35069.1 hypothetical protein Mpet_0292 [Methanolacinia petrolearia DSM 11571]
MSHSGGRSSIGGVRDLSRISPVLLELAGLKSKTESSLETGNKQVYGGVRM